MLAEELHLIPAIGIAILGCSKSPTSNSLDPTVSEQISLGKSGFDEFGYNYDARIFVGAADGVDKILDGKVWGDPTYANDHLVMKWSQGWDDARFHGGVWGPDAWVNNEWNGTVPDGSGETGVAKVIWVGVELENSPYWRDGGYAIWTEFEVMLEHYSIANVQTWYGLATPAGYGGN
jgi:hypothetical protein